MSMKPEMFEIVRGWLMLTQLHIENRATSISWTRSQEKRVEKSSPEAANWRDMLLEVYEELKARLESEESIGPCEAGWNMEPSLLRSDPKLLTFQDEF